MKSRNRRLATAFLVLVAWIDLHVDDQGTINRPIDALDYMSAWVVFLLGGCAKANTGVVCETIANLLLILYQETHAEKYKLAAQNPDMIQIAFFIGA